MTLYVGTSGWAYKEWKPGFYPEGTPQAKFLEHYSTVLSACEINATFYRLQKQETIARWGAAVPESFRFSAKAHRRLTHGRQIAPDAEQRGFLDTFLGSVAILGPRLGAVLFQFPPYRHRDDAAFGALLQALPAGTPYAFEFRHESWVAPEIYERIAGAGGTVCVSETEGVTPPSLPPGPIGYVRLRTDRYSEEARAAWRDLLLSEGAERDCFAFAKHEGIPADDPYGGIGLASWLARQTS
jgi:uncharacterized protein YecE (DUF72 family)